MGMADDEVEMVSLDKQIEMSRKYWYAAGSQMALDSYSYAMNQWLDSLAFMWGNTRGQITKEAGFDHIRQVSYLVSEILEKLDKFADTYLRSDFIVSGFDDDNDLSREFSYRVMANYLDLSYDIYTKLSRNPEYYFRVFGCRKNQHFAKIQDVLTTTTTGVRQLGIEWLDQAPNPSWKLLYELITDEPSRLGIVFGKTTDNPAVSECICQECNACCGQECKCKYQHHDLDEVCLESLDDECAINSHYACVNCAAECQCC